MKGTCLKIVNWPLSIVHWVVCFSFALLFSSCLTTSAIRSANDVEFFGGSNRDTYNYIDSVYIIKDSIAIIKMIGSHFYNATDDNDEWSYMYYTIPLKTKKKVIQLYNKDPNDPDNGSFDISSHTIKNNNRIYEKQRDDGIGYGPLFKKFILQGDSLAKLDDTKFSRLYYKGFKGYEYVYDLEHKQETTALPDMHLVKNCKGYGNLKKESIEKDFTYKKGSYIAKGTHINAQGQVETNYVAMTKDSVAKGITSGYYFPINKDSMFFFDKDLYHSINDGYKLRVIAKEERSIGYCFINRKDSTVKVGTIYIPRTYNKIHHPAYLLELPFAFILDIPLQVLWFPVALYLSIRYHISIFKLMPIVQPLYK